MIKTTLTASRELAEGTMEFSFAKPEGFSYIAGQSVDLTLVKPPETDTEGNTRTFSLASAPHEPVLRVATRMRDTAYKRSLKTLPEGTPVEMQGPFGSFFLHENTARPAVFLAGGIGITPFLSMIADATERGLAHKLYLFYSNRRPEDAAYLDELSALAEKNPNFTFVPTMTAMERSGQPWDGLRGYVDARMLEAQVPRDASPIYYMAGPQPMTLAMRNMLQKEKISNDDIRFEEFAGY